jgi:hypothetical protein
VNDDPEIERALLAGQKIKAIQIYRRATGAGLKEAKSAIEDRERQLRPAGKAGPPPYRPQQRLALQLSLLVLVICLLILALLRTWNASHVHL